MDNTTIYWDNICTIYFLTKHYILLAEEISDDFDTFLQPLKEHRDAFDHIVRVYGSKFLNEPLSNVESYQQENMNKAVGHVYRAFFDTADWLTYICRRKIRESIQNLSYAEIIQAYPQYKDLKKRLIEIPTEIAKIREKKDISDDEKVLIKEVEQYKKILDELIASYNEIKQIF